MKDKKSKPDSFTATEVGTLLEELRADFRAFGEDLSSVKSKLDMLFSELAKQKEDVFVIKADIRIIKVDIAEIKETLKGHVKRLTALEATK